MKKNYIALALLTALGVSTTKPRSHKRMPKMTPAHNIPHVSNETAKNVAGSQGTWMHQIEGNHTSSIPGGELGDTNIAGQKWSHEGGVQNQPTTTKQNKRYYYTTSRSKFQKR